LKKFYALELADAAKDGDLSSEARAAVELSAMYKED
jgi:hypothetical protein